MTYARYDYAWKTPGWTAQNPTVPTTTDGYFDPGLPEDISLVRLYGSFGEVGTGRPIEGVLRLRTNTDLLHVPSKTLYPRGEMFRIRFTRYRPLSVYIPATHDPQFVGDSAWKYEAHLQVRGKHYNFEFSAPAASAELDLVSLIP